MEEACWERLPIPTATAVPGAKITATETSTAVKQPITADGRGFYSFQSLAVGRYEVAVEAAGFKPLRRTDIAIDVNSKVVVDLSLSLWRKDRYGDCFRIGNAC